MTDGLDRVRELRALGWDAMAKATDEELYASRFDEEHGAPIYRRWYEAGGEDIGCKHQGFWPEDFERLGLEEDGTPRLHCPACHALFYGDER